MVFLLIKPLKSFNTTFLSFIRYRFFKLKKFFLVLRLFLIRYTDVIVELKMLLSMTHMSFIVIFFLIKCQMISGLKVLHYFTCTIGTTGSEWKRNESINECMSNTWTGQMCTTDSLCVNSNLHQWNQKQCHLEKRFNHKWATLSKIV